jgi:cell division septum initiation protein DivIVA
LQVLAELEGLVERSDEALRAAQEHARRIEAELTILYSEVGAFRAREQQIADALAAAHRRAQELEETADAQARAVIARAEEEAAKVRGNAHLQVEAVGQQIQQLLALKGKTLASVRSALNELDRTIGRVERGEVELTEESHDAPAAEARSAAVPVDTTIAAGASAPEADGCTFSGRIEIDAGPFADFGSLSAFERALARLPHVADVYVRRFADERALIELTLSEAIPLLAAMQATLPYRLETESPTPNSLRVNVLAALAVTY